MADDPVGGEAITLQTVSGWRLTQVFGWHDRLDGVETIGGIPIPAAVGRTAETANLLAIRISPGRLWVISDGGFDLESITASLDPAAACALDLTAGRRRFRLQGSALNEVFSKLFAVDPDGTQLAPGHAVQSAIHHVPVLVLRVAENCADILVPVSFAQSIHEWIEDACLEFRNVSDNGRVIS